MIFLFSFLLLERKFLVPFVVVILVFLMVIILGISLFLITLSSIAESMNATISTLLFNTKGIRNIERRRKRIMYAVNKTGFLLK